MAEETDYPSDEEIEQLMHEIERERSPARYADAEEAYSLRIDPSFRGPTTVCIARAGDRVTLTARSRARMFDPEREVHKPLSAKEWDARLWALHRADFWELPPWHPQLGLDGETWTIEGRQGDRYHSSSHWWPPAGPYRDLGRVFLDLAGL
jgi:hypothetical protein